MVVLIAVAGITSLVVKMLSGMGSTKYDTEAGRLATLRMELVRNERDMNLWGDFEDGCYRVAGSALERIGPPPCAASSVEGDTKYNERIIVSEVDSSTRKVEVYITYEADLKEKSIDLVSYLTNWRIK